MDTRSAEEIRKHLKETAWNGEYVIDYCRKCGNTHIGPDGNTAICKIKDVCEECFDD